MSDDTKFAVFNKTQKLSHSIYSDFMTGVMIAFCVYISQGSTWWTFVTGLMFIIFMGAKITAAMKRYKQFKTKEELQAWVDTLEDT